MTPQRKAAFGLALTVQAAQGRLSGISFPPGKSFSCGAFVRARRALSGPIRRFPARAAGRGGGAGAGVGGGGELDPGAHGRPLELAGAANPEAGTYGLSEVLKLWSSARCYMCSEAASKLLSPKRLSPYSFKNK